MRLLALVLLLGALAPAAAAQDTVVASGPRPVVWARVLGKTVLFALKAGHDEPYSLHRVIGGRVLRALALQGNGRIAEAVERMGRDRAGRRVVPVRAGQLDHGRLVPAGYAYDVGRDTVRPLQSVAARRG